MTKIAEVFAEYGIDVSEAQIQVFEQLLERFIHWNGVMNLSSIRSPAEIILKHFVDSLLPTLAFDFEYKKILDLGTGGGFPALPLGIFTNRKSPITAVDSVGKKLKAVQAMADELHLRVKTVQERIETLGQDLQFREKFDIVTARALAPWPVLLEYALPFVRVGGWFIAYQGPAIADDLATFAGLEGRLGGVVDRVTEFQLGEVERRLVWVHKKYPTSKKFPRGVGVPKKEPLG